LAREAWITVRLLVLLSSRAWPQLRPVR